MRQPRSGRRSRTPRSVARAPKPSLARAVFGSQSPNVATRQTGQGQELRRRAPSRAPMTSGLSSRRIDAGVDRSAGPRGSTATHQAPSARRPRTRSASAPSRIPPPHADGRFVRRRSRSRDSTQANQSAEDRTARRARRPSPRWLHTARGTERRRRRPGRGRSAPPMGRCARGRAHHRDGEQRGSTGRRHDVHGRLERQAPRLQHDGRRGECPQELGRALDRSGRSG